MSDSKTPAWKSEFSTNRQQVENITVEQSLDIISGASTTGIKGANGQVYVPESKMADGTTISLRVKEAKALEDQQKANPNKNPFANASNAKRQAPPMVDIYKK